MPSHQAKRQYGGTHSQNQATITSYFNPSSGTPNYTTSSLRPTSEITSSLSPQLPANIQSNLLSVGMRVRKSVPEGYKTGSYSAFSLFSDSDPVKSHPAVASSSQPRPTASSYSYGRQELTPFCGILKVGGLAQQAVPEEDDVPFLSSQGSTNSDVSIYSVAMGAGKRRLDEDEEEIEEERDVEVLDASHFGGGNIWHDGEISPRTKPIARFGLVDASGLGGRAMAVPRSRRKGVERSLGGNGGMKVFGSAAGQENVMIDFEDAEFLDYGAWEEKEVQMSDV